MSLLTLKDIGKIYASKGNVAVGIRGVNLSFERGEFVAITGKSGSGKSTLLSVISGMDSYEEGDLLIEGESTSHYLQADFEEYRERYISFIFQDYNIIESFTVLQNVELALLHIDDKKERRARALDLIDRVGLTPHLSHKGSKLSGGQKQRTVIARALAKDSPIILADEPTGNLDAATSKEILKLLHEVSRDKLVLVVTHSFDEVERYATRHIRILDGAVELDHVLRPVDAVPTAPEEGKASSDGADMPEKAEPRGGQKAFRREFKKGALLGKALLFAKPRLTAFLCALLMIGTLGIFATASLCGEMSELFDDSHMFHHIDGRVVLTTADGSVMTADELSSIAEEYGAVDYLRYDSLLDQSTATSLLIPFGDTRREFRHLTVSFAYGESFGEQIIGRYPEAENEVFLHLPISYQPIFGKDMLLFDTVLLESAELKVTGVKYFYDNTKDATCLFTGEGFRTATAIHHLLARADLSMTLSTGGTATDSLSLKGICPSFHAESGKLYINSAEYRKLESQHQASGTDFDPHLSVRINYRKYNYYMTSSDSSHTFEFDLDKSSFTEGKPLVYTHTALSDDNTVIMSTDLIRALAESVLSVSYRQSSLFFADDHAAEDAALRLREAGFIAVPSNTTYTPSADDAILGTLAALGLLLVFVLSVIFLAFFVNLCSGRALGAFKGDMAIMRSMGISVGLIKIGMYTRMLLSLIPAFLALLLAAVLIFTSPRLNDYFVFLHAWQYLLIFLGMLGLTLRVTQKQIKNLFGESVRKSLRGGDEA